MQKIWRFYLALIAAQTAFLLILRLWQAQADDSSPVERFFVPKKPSAGQNVFAFQNDDLLDVDGDVSRLLKELGVDSFRSDTAYLKHCNLSLLNTSAFITFRDLLLPVVTNRKRMMERFNATDIFDELTLQSLELFARGTSLCDFAQYQPSIPASLSQRNELQRFAAQLPMAPADQARIVYCISVHDDFDQVKALVDAILLPQHLILLHLERRASATLLDEIRGLARQYQTNVLVLQYGSVTYPSDSLSHIFLQLMRLVTVELQLEYDYFVTLGASSYPLWGADELARKLQSEPKRVRIGRLVDPLEGNRKYCRTYAKSFGVVVSRQDIPKKHIPFRGFLGKKKFPPGLPQESDYLPKNMTYCFKKSNSGNTAAYDRKAVESLLTNPAAVEFLSRFKHSGMCCNEEVSWAGALGLIGRNEEVDQVGMIWQGWECKEKSMRNAALMYKNERDESAPCMDIQDAISLKESEVQQSRHVRGNAALELELRNARERGHLFARKFQSSSPEWVDWIRKNLHESARTDA